MLFNSLHFLFFLPIVVVLYYLLPHRHRWILIFFSSCYFYMAFVPEYILILFFVIAVDYVSGIAIEGSSGKKRKFFLLFSLLSNILLLAFFKYFNFMNENLSALAGLFGGNFQGFNLNILLPIGLSFHTFQSMSYTIEVYRGRQKAERHLGYFANYVLFFPQMVAGPIERYEHLGEQLKMVHTPRYDNFSRGFRLILFGLFVKMAVADNIAPVVNAVFADPSAHNGFNAWIAMFLFSFQIYADFYGYSTIAVGCARMLDISIMDNFKTPYLSSSVSEFWSRWHISLSTWFRDYLYIPLGGNRVSLPRWSVNILIVFMVSGLWHGASWTFVVWGALHGLMLLAERYAGMLFPFTRNLQNEFINGVRILRTFFLVSVAWVFFRAETFANAKEMFKALLFRFDRAPAELQLRWPLFFVLLLILSDLLVYNSRFDERISPFNLSRRWAVYGVLLFCLLALAGTQKYAFIYFQF